MPNKLSNQAIKNWMVCVEKYSPNNLAKLNKNGSYTINMSGEIASIHP